MMYSWSSTEDSCRVKQPFDDHHLFKDEETSVELPGTPLSFLCLCDVSRLLLERKAFCPVGTIFPPENMSALGFSRLDLLGT